MSLSWHGQRTVGRLVGERVPLADRLFGKVWGNLEAAELFLPAGALCTHDWGMAVGSKEQAYLRHGARAEDLGEDFTPLHDESQRLIAFARAQGLEVPSGQAFPGLSDCQLREYVRQTHARRSGARALALFPAHPALDRALAHLCEGHWHDVATLNDPDRFPRTLQVVGQTVNILALALQVRLIDRQLPDAAEQGLSRG